MLKGEKMAKNIDPNSKKIGDYLQLDNNAMFIIPEYQRAYSWGINNCDKLWQDIVDFSNSEKKDNYFFGTIIINCLDEDTKLELIDGQQRTTTFLLLLKALLLNINKAILEPQNDADSEGLCRGLKARRRKIMKILYRAEDEDISDEPDEEKDKKIFDCSAILKNNSINERYSAELTKILQATSFANAEKNVEHLKFKQKDNKYTNFFRNFQYFYNKIKNEMTERRMNNFAKTLLENCEVIEIKSWNVEQAINMFNSLNSDGLPLYDSDIIAAKLYACANGKNQTEKYSKLWTELKTQIALLEETGIADINGILMQYMYYLRTINGDTIGQNGNANVTTPGLRRYFTQDNTTPIKNPVEMCSNLLKLVYAWQKVSKYEIVKILLKFNENTKLFLASYLLRFERVDDMTEDEVNEIAICLMRLFAVLELVDIGFSSKAFKIFLFQEEVDFANSNVSADKIKKDFDKHINSSFDKSQINLYAKDYDGNILVYLNEYLFAQEKKVAFCLGAKYDIEHIMPHSGNNHQLIRRDAGIRDEEEFNAIVNKLGNKILLEEKINRSIGNEWFRTKISSKLENKTGYVNGKFPIASHLVSKYKDDEKPFWTKADILAATEKAADRITDFIFNGLKEEDN